MSGEIAYTFDGVPLLLANLNRYYALLNMEVNTDVCYPVRCLVKGR